MKLVISVLVFFLSCLLSAQDLSTHFRHLNSKDGLSSDNVTCFFKDSKGFLWLGTRGDGLNRFDGRNVRRFRHIAGDDKSLLDNDVTDIGEDTKGRIWVATKNGLSILNYDLKFRNYKQLHCDTGNLDISTGIHSLIRFKGSMFLGLGNGIVNVDDDLKNVVRSDALLSKGKLPEKLRCIPNGMQVTSSGIWISTHKGMFFSADGKEFFHKGYNPKGIRIFEMGFIPAFTESENGDIVFMSWGFPGVYIYNQGNGRTDSVKISDESEFSPISMIQVKDNIYWASTMFKGVAEIDIKKGTFRFIKSDPKIIGSLSNDGVNELFKDGQGNIFVTTGAGIDYVHPSQCNFNQVKTIVSDQTDFPTRSLYCLYEDQNRQLWAGSFTNGLYKIDLASGNTFRVFLNGDENSIWSLSEQEGRLLLGTYSGIGTYDALSNKFRKWKLPEEIIGNTENGITFIVRDNKENWWIGLWQIGLLQVSKDLSSFRFFSPSDTNAKVKYNTPVGGAVDGQNRLWFGYMESTEVTCIDMDKFSASHYFTVDEGSDLDHGGSSSMEILKGSLWITTTNTGLLKFDIESHKTTVYNTSNGMPSDNMNFVEYDGKGSLWIGTTAGLVKFNTSTLTPETYHFSDGLPTENLGDADLIFLHDGRAIMTCDRYLLSFLPERMTVNPYFPKVALTSVKKSGVDVTLVPGLNEIDIFPRDKMLSFEFTGINFIDADKNIYSYRLEGFYDQWISLGNNNTLNLTNLPEGEYILFLNCSNKAGMRNPELLKFMIHVHGPFWKTWWFMSLMGLLVIGLMYGIYRYRLFRIYQLQAIRDNISRDLHDDIGSALSSISIYSEVAKKMSHDKFPEIMPTLQNLQATAKSAMENMSDIVWAINPKNDRFQDLIERIEIFANQMFSAGGVQFKYDVAQEVTLKTLSIQQRKNIYMICKEAINNVAKYAEAQECSLNIYKEAQSVVIEIKDNGKGIASEGKPNFGGHGMINMKKRAEELNGILDIISGQLLGTRLVFKLNI